MVKSFKPRYKAVPKTVSSPLALRLTRPSSWHSDDDVDGPYDVVRFHFLVEERPLLEKGYGDATESITSSTNATMETRKKVTFHYEEVDTTSLIQEHMQSSGLAAKLNADARLGSESFGSAGFASALEENFTETFNTTHTVESARTKSYTFEEEITVTVVGGEERAVHAAPYRRYEMTVRLHHVDYLVVKYISTHGGLRVRRVKTPPFVNPDKSHQNFVSSGLLLGRYEYWRPEGNASRNIVSVTEHEANHINPRDVTFEPDDTNDRRYYDRRLFDGTHSLYKISNAAFPLKDSQRRKTWTEGEIEQLPEWDFRDSSWAWENLRRKRRAARRA